jgi:hypothetical protein
MKRIFVVISLFFAVLLLGIFYFRSKGDNETLSVSIAALAGEKGDRSLSYYNPHFYVIVSNVSKKPQRVWKEWCSWGYFALSFEITDKSGKTWIAERDQSRQFTMNFPDLWVLAPKENLVIPVHFGDKKLWKGFPDPQTVTMKAIFEIKPDKETEERAVWTGRIESKADKYTFLPWPD